MPHVSKSRLSKIAEEDIKQTFSLVLSNITRDDETNEFLNSLLSPTEKLMLSKRLAIVLLLDENISTSQIAATLHVTRETVSRIELLYQVKPEGYKTALNKINNQKIITELKKSLLKLTNYTLRAAGGYVKP
jgi:Trp operon repressor